MGNHNFVASRPDLIEGLTDLSSLQALLNKPGDNPRDTCLLRRHLRVLSARQMQRADFDTSGAPDDKYDLFPLFLSPSLPLSTLYALKR